MEAPRPLTLAVTGHRRLPDAPAVMAAISAVLAELGAPPSGRPGRAGTITLLSPLAEGADRLAAHEVLRRPGGVLHAVLPLQQDDYEKDFATPASRQEFRDLLARAASVDVLPPRPTRADAYHAVGCRVVDASDMVLAIWDGQPPRGIGGTASVVAHARDIGKPLIIIDSNDPARVVRERLPEGENDPAP